MTATELRIGNLIIYNGGQPDDIDELTVVSIDEIKWCFQDNKGFNEVFKPIPLTQDWLLKFGLYISGSGSEYFNNTRLWLYKLDPDIGYGMFLNDDCTVNDYYTGVVVNYVHKLQNLFFELEDEELKK